MNSSDDQIVKLELPLKEVNQLLTYLGKQKYSQVAVLIAKIQTQTLKQVNPEAFAAAQKESAGV